MSITSLVAAILLSASSPQEAATRNMPNRPGEQPTGRSVVPADPAEALALAERLESEGRDALDMGWRYAAERFRQALAIRRAFQDPDHPAIAQCLYLLSRAYSQQGYVSAAANLLEEADATASGDFGGRIAEMRAREGDYTAVRDYLLADGSLDSLEPWDRTFLDAMVALETGDAAAAERGLSIVTQTGSGGHWFDLPLHRFRAHIGLIRTRQTLGLTAGALSASQSLLTQMTSPPDGDSLVNDLPAREAEQATGEVVDLLLEAGVRADHMGEIGEGARLLEGGLELERTSIEGGQRRADGAIRLAEAGLFLGQPNRALAVADRLDEAGDAGLADAIRARVSGALTDLAFPSPQPIDPNAAQWGPHVAEAYILGVAASIALSDGRPEAAASLAAKAVELYRADLTATAEPDALDRELAVGRLAAALSVLADTQTRQGMLAEAQQSLDEAMTLQIAQWCPAAAGAMRQAGYGWSRDPRPCLGHPALAVSVETEARLATAGRRWTAAFRLYRHAGDIALGRTLSRYSLQDDAQAEFVRFARFHRATVTSAWYASE